MGLATLRPESEEDGKYKDYEDAVGFVMIGVGVLYFLMVRRATQLTSTATLSAFLILLSENAQGVLCLRGIKENREELVQLRREDWQFHHRHGAAVA